MLLYNLMVSKLEALNYKVKTFFKRHSFISTKEKHDLIETCRLRYCPLIFIETGTFLGDTVHAFLHKFHKIYSIELSKDLAKEAAIRFKPYDHVEILQGDSSTVLLELVPNIKDQAFFWLDGHYSSEFYIGNRFIKTAKGEKNTPILEELDIILSSPVQHVILIDDARLFNGKNDYPSLKSIRQMVSSSKHYYKLIVDKDIIQILP